MARGNWNPDVIKPAIRCRLCARVVKKKDLVRLDGIYPAHKVCADWKGRAYTLELTVKDEPQQAVEPITLEGLEQIK